MNIIGIDPGLTGAVAIIGDYGINLIDMPVVAKSTRGKQVDGAALAQIFLEERTRAFVYLEQVGAMPGQGVTSMFNFGHGYGIVQGVLYSLCIPFQLVTPQKWKKHHGLIGKQKDMARTLCIQRHPELSGQLKRKKDIGRADALLIAEYGKSIQ